MLDKAYILKEQTLIKECQEWFCRTLGEIESKAKKLTGDATGEKEESAIIIDRRNLEKEAFGETLESFIKRKGINYEFEYSLSTGNSEGFETGKGIPGSNAGDSGQRLLEILKGSGIVSRQFA